MTIKEKIIQYLKYKELTPTKAERELNWGVGAFTKAKSITVDRAKEFLLLYSDLSAEWLFRGKGEMIQKDSSSSYIDDATTAIKEKINQRIREFIDSLGVSDNQFAKSIGITQSVIASMFSRNTEPSSKVIVSILNAYANLSAEWLMTGKGEMLQKNFSQTNADASLQQIYDSVLKGKDNEIKKLEAEINMLKGENRLLRELAGIEEGKNKSETKTA